MRPKMLIKKAKVVHLELTEGQVLAILNALPKSGYSQTVMLMRKIDKQLESQTNEDFKAVRKVLTSGSSSLNFTDRLCEVLDRMNT